MAVQQKVAELTLKSVLTGIIFGVIFGAANAYLGLRVGLTVTTSIPIAVLSIAVFRAGVALWGKGTILEANIAQTIGSASSSLATGTIFTIPALFLWGAPPSYTQVAILAFLGGILGVCAMIPLRRLLIVQADAELPYPEGRACAEVLKASTGETSASKWIFIGLAVGFLVKLALGLIHLMPDQIRFAISGLPKAQLALEIAPALIAVGYIIGYRASGIMWHWKLPYAILVTAGFLFVDLAFFGANIIKVAQGGWFPLLVGVFVFTLFTTWERVKERVEQLDLNYHCARLSCL